MRKADSEGSGMVFALNNEAMACSANEGGATGRLSSNPRGVGDPSGGRMVLAGACERGKVLSLCQSGQ